MGHELKQLVEGDIVKLVTLASLYYSANEFVPYLARMYRYFNNDVTI
jgi:Zn-dependent protease with chaperone function